MQENSSRNWVNDYAEFSDGALTFSPHPSHLRGDLEFLRGAFTVVRLHCSAQNQRGEDNFTNTTVKLYTELP